jgi:UDP-N-acetylglucosamine 1-carboxyvinyltransferase
MGVTISLLGTSAIEIIGNDNLLGVNYKVMPDRIETLTWLIYGILSGGKIFIKESPFNSMEIPLIHIYNAGIDFFKNQKDIFINQSCINQFGIQPFELACGTYPGIISDMQPFFVLLATKAQGRSLIIDYRYPNRTAYVDELNKMLKNKISYKPGEIIVNGPSEFYSSDVNSTDLRGSMAVILAALLVKDKTFSIINDPDLALRGYNKLLFKLENLGIKVCYEN